LQFPSRLRAISLTSKNRERGKFRAIPKALGNKFAALLKSHRAGPIGTPPSSAVTGGRVSWLTLWQNAHSDGVWK
jgi:hypothetical protein